MISLEKEEVSFKLIEAPGRNWSSESDSLIPVANNQFVWLARALYFKQVLIQVRLYYFKKKKLDFFFLWLSEAAGAETVKLVFNP